MKSIKELILRLVWDSYFSYPIKSKLSNKIKNINLKRPPGLKYLDLMDCLLEIIKFQFFNNKKEIISVFDLNDSPETIGDFIYWVMLNRYLRSKFKVNLVLIQKKSDFSVKDIQLKFLNKFFSNAEINICSNFDELNNKEFYQDSFFLFKKKIKNRKRAYKYYFNFLCLFYNFYGSNDEKQFLLDKVTDIPEKYKIFFDSFSNNICLHCRYTPSSSNLFSLEKVRNTSEKEFIRLFKAIQKKFPSKKIFIISDHHGYEFFKEIALNNSLNCYFTKDYFDDFLLDCEFILNSQAYFQLNGGGISTIAMFSCLPYFICSKKATNEFLFSSSKIVPWARDNQIFKEITFNEEFYHYFNFYSYSDKKV